MLATGIVMKLKVIFVASTFFVVVAHAEPVKKLGCQCILATSLCNFARFDDAAGKPRQEWSQNFSLPPVTTPSPQDMALACWRKRNAPAGGQGLCCEMHNGEGDAERYFKGRLLD
jgi:hypothetical protein